MNFPFLHFLAMKIDILVCTIDQGLCGVSRVLMPPAPGVHYVVSVQHTRDLEEMGEEWGRALAALEQRSDVTVTMLAGRGLSRNRNNALRAAEGDIIVIADDDCRYTEERIDSVRQAYLGHPEADVICFQAETYDGQPLKRYPPTPMPYAQACRKGYYPASVEMTFRRSSIATAGLRFDERFGIGAQYPASEEEIFLCDAIEAGLRVEYVPQPIVQTDPVTTGSRFLSDERLQTTKGAVFRRRYGLCPAIWRTLKEGLYHFIHSGVNPVPIYKNMWRGICEARHL